MYARRIAIVVGIMIFGLGATCRGQLPDEEGTIDDLRREVAELKKTVAELRERLQTLEYQQLPRMKSEVRDVPPEIVPLSKPGVRKIEPRSQPTGPLRFPIEVERAMFPAPWLPLRRPMR